MTDALTAVLTPATSSKWAKVASDAGLPAARRHQRRPWEAFALLVGAISLHLAVHVRGLPLLRGRTRRACVAWRSMSDTPGLLVRRVAQTHTGFIALVVQLVVLWFNIRVLSPWQRSRPLMWKRYWDRCRRRHATRNLHGLARVGFAAALAQRGDALRARLLGALAGDQLPVDLADRAPLLRSARGAIAQRPPGVRRPAGCR